MDRSEPDKRDIENFVAFVREKCGKPLTPQDLVELRRLDELADSFIQLCGQTITHVPLTGPRDIYFGKTKIPTYAGLPQSLLPCLELDKWLEMMERLKAAQPDPEVQRRRTEQAQRKACWDEMERLAAEPCVDPQQCLTWCKSATVCLENLARLSPGGWAIHDATAKLLAEGARNHAMNLGADSDTLAFLEDQMSRSIFHPTLGLRMPAGVARTIVQRLTEWCQRAESNVGTGARSNQARAGEGEGTEEGGPVVPTGVREDAEEELNDRQRDILTTMLREEITSRRRRKTQAEIVRLINRLHNATTYKRYFAALTRRGWLQSEPGPEGGVWLSHQYRPAIEQALSSN
jgi:hypothetical protein